MDLQLDDRVFVITGGSAGLGFATAEALVAEGARVVLSARGAERLEAAVRQLGSQSTEGVVADLADPATPDRLIAAARTRFGRLDGVLISVGGPAPATPMQMTDEAWHAAISSVFVGAVRLARQAVESMPEGGVVAFILSTTTKVPITGLAASNALRPGLAMHVKDLADEVGPRGVRVVGILPGRVATDRVASLDAASGDADAARAAHEAGIPLRRYGRPAEVGRVAAFLLSPAASYITGTTVAVDGGSLRTL